MNIELNNEEAQVLLNLIDVAVKAAGLPAAEAALHFSKKINEAAKPVEKTALPPAEEPAQ